MILNQDNLSIEIFLSTNSDGNLNINLPRDNIDAITNNGEDIEFIVLIYEKDSEMPVQTDYNEINSDNEFR